MRLFFLSQNLEGGGAERQLTALAGGLAQRGHDVHVVSFYGGAYTNELIGKGCKVTNLNKHGRWDIVPFLWRLYTLLNRTKPDVLHAYLPVPNIIAALLKPFIPKTVLVWGIRAAGMDMTNYDCLTCLSYRLERRLSFAADLLIANSRKGATHAILQGFPEERLHVIPNGIDTERFYHAPALKNQVRYELGLPDDVPVIGMFARHDPMKDHQTFLKAAALLARRHPSVHFLLAGQHVDAHNPVFATAYSGPLQGRVILLGRRNDVPHLLAAIDVYCQSSAFGEGFPNVLGEAMACGVPCVATDVGDAAEIVGTTGIIVPPSDPAALAEGLQDMLTRLTPQTPAETRARIVTHFSLMALLDKTENLLAKTLQGQSS